MTDKELRKLSRGDLMQIMLDQSREIERLQKRLSEAKRALQDRTIKIDQAGSIAEASLQLNGVFEAAQAACKQYTENISTLSQRQEQVCAKRDRESCEAAARLIAEAEQQKAEMERTTKLQCDQMLEKAKTDSQKYWDDVSAKLQPFVENHAELSALLSMMTPKK